MEYAAVRKNMETLYEWVWRDCQDVLSKKKARSEKWHYSMLTFVWTGRKIIICMHKETEIMAKKQTACERAMQWAEGGWETLFPF